MAMLKRALVCGASQGIGRSVAKHLADDGVQVIALSRSASLLESLIEELPGEGHALIACDLADRGQVETSLKAELAKGPITILINNTGGPKGGPIVDAELDEFVQAFEHHIVAASFLAQQVLPGMKEAQFGRIVNVISTSVKQPIPGLGVSNTIRGAMASWAKTWSLEVAPFGITVNNVLPGFTNTKRLESLLSARAEREGKSLEELRRELMNAVPAKRFAEAEDIASAVAFLASDKASYINGINLPVDGGRTGSL